MKNLAVDYYIACAALSIHMSYPEAAATNRNSDPIVMEIIANCDRVTDMTVTWVDTRRIRIEQTNRVRKSRVSNPCLY